MFLHESICRTKQWHSLHFCSVHSHVLSYFKRLCLIILFFHFKCMRMFVIRLNFSVLYLKSNVRLLLLLLLLNKHHVAQHHTEDCINNPCHFSVLKNNPLMRRVSCPYGILPTVATQPFLFVAVTYKCHAKERLVLEYPMRFDEVHRTFHT